jgi:hypothetical protein
MIRDGTIEASALAQLMREKGGEPLRILSHCYWSGAFFRIEKIFTPTISLKATFLPGAL